MSVNMLCASYQELQIKKSIEELLEGPSTQKNLRCNYTILSFDMVKFIKTKRPSRSPAVALSNFSPLVAWTTNLTIGGKGSLPLGYPSLIPSVVIVPYKQALLSASILPGLYRVSD